MRRFLFGVILLVSAVLVLPSVVAANKKASSIDMSKVHTVYIGYINLSPEEYRRQGYSTEKEYKDVLNRGVSSFIDSCKRELKGQEIKVSESSADADASKSDLYLKFTDARYDHGYRLHIAVHFIDPKTNQELATIPLKVRGAHLCGLEGCLAKEFDEVARDIAKTMGLK